MSEATSRRRRRRSATECEKHSVFQRLLSRERARNWRETCWRLTSSEGSRSGEVLGGASGGLQLGLTRDDGEDDFVGEVLHCTWRCRRRW
jgi:hypothetical protein